MLSLEQAGLIERRQGRGTRVIRPAPRGPVPPSLSSHLDAGYAEAGSSMRLKAFEEIAPPEVVREALELAPGAPAWKLVRVREGAGRPLWLVHNYFPGAVGAALQQVRWSRTTLFDALRRVGFPCLRAEEIVGATLADPEIAREIGVKVGAPLLELSRVMLDIHERPIAYQLTLVPPERRRLRLNIAPGERGPPEVSVLPPQAGTFD
jgi:GntR family transcriptional regulator